MPTEAEEYFLRMVAKLDTYGVDPHCAKVNTFMLYFLLMTDSPVVGVSLLLLSAYLFNDCTSICYRCVFIILLSYQ